MSSSGLFQFLQVFLGSHKTHKTVLLLAVRGKHQGGGRPPDSHLLHQVHVIAPLQAHRNEALIQSFYYRRILMGLTDQPAAMGSPFHIEFQGQGSVGLLGFFQGLGPVAAPLH